MPTLSVYSNTENTALVIISNKGYQCWYKEEEERYYAEKNGWDFSADSITELLGAVSIFEDMAPEEYEEYWWRIREPWLIDQVAKEPKKYQPVWKK